MHLRTAVKTILFACIAGVGFTSGPALAQHASVEETVPYRVQDLQDIHSTYQSRGLVDQPINEEMDALDLDIRRDAQREAALSFGARGGLAKRNYEIMQRLRGHEDVLDQVFNFRQLLIKAPSGMLIEPPIVREALDALTVIDEGQEAAVSDRVYNISKRAKITTAPRNWRQYLQQDWSEVRPPPEILWPRDESEEANWNKWISQGWERGYSQAEEMFEANLNRLQADFTGMIRYKMLLAKGLVFSPYAMHEDRGVTGGGEQMRVGDRAIRITGPAQFNTSPESWQALDR